MKAKINFFIGVLLVFLNLACATHSNELVIKKMKASDRIYAGRLIVDMNGQSNKELKCELYLNNSLLADIKLTEDGYLFIKSDNKKFRLSKIACYDQIDLYSAAWHHQRLPFSGLTQSDSTEKAAYFGDIYLNWKINPEETRAAARNDTSTPAYPKVGVVQNSGFIKIEVKDEFESIKPIFADKVKDKSWRASDAPIELEKSIIQISNED